MMLCIGNVLKLIQDGKIVCVLLQSGIQLSDIYRKFCYMLSIMSIFSSNTAYTYLPLNTENSSSRGQAILNLD